MQQGGSHPSSRCSAAVVLKNQPEMIRAAEEEVISATKACGYSEASCFAVRLALEEAVYNAFRHGHRNLPPEETVDLSWQIQKQTVTITVTDKGPGFDPRRVPDPTREDRLELPHGRGLMLMKAYMSKVEYNDKGNRVTMVYERPAE